MSETPQIALLMITSSGYDRGLLEGITSYAQAHGPWMMFVSGDHPDLPIPATDSLSGDLTGREYLPSGNSKSLLAGVKQLNVSGAIGRVANVKMAKELLAAKLPVVADFSLPDAERAKLDLDAKMSQIAVDAAKTGRLAAEHFLERGFWHFAYCGYEGRAWSERRLAGYAERLHEAGFAANVYRPAKFRGCLTWKQEMPMVASWLETLPRPVGVMACNDKRGRQVLDACLSVGLKVPEEIAVVGVDNDYLFGNLSNPPLSSVALNSTKAGFEAAELLDKQMRGAVRKPGRITIDPLWVVTRRSSDFIATEDPHVAVALRFIRDHAKEAIEVGDIVRETGISRRSLEIRFQAVVKRSIRSEIQRVRIEAAKQLLAETNLPVERIALLTGFCSLSHLGSMFRHDTGMTPARYRREVRGS